MLKSILYGEIGLVKLIIDLGLTDSKNKYGDNAYEQACICDKIGTRNSKKIKKLLDKQV